MKKTSILPYMIKRTLAFLATYLAGALGGLLIVQTFFDPEVSLDNSGFVFLFISLFMFSDLVKIGAQFGYDRKTLYKTQVVLIGLLSLASSLIACCFLPLGQAKEIQAIMDGVYGNHIQGMKQMVPVVFVLQFLLSSAISMIGLAFQTLYLRIGKINFFIFLGITGVSLAEIFFPDGKLGYQRMSLFIEWLVKSPVNPAMVCLATCILMAAVSFPIFKKAPLGLRPGKA